ncbi:MAG: ribosome biogenesis GTPase Der [Thermoanaerobacterales bacterium]|nr:ribosome biogenesis GTPase Der [Thermoanaerobacterales bacterium]
MRKPILAIVGRPNVGKSTLFNRIVGGRAAVVEAQPGVTRDRIHREAEWAGVPFTVVDTGGIATVGDDMAARVTAQARRAIEEADVILFLLDGGSGLLPEDHEVAEILRRAAKPVIVAVNKVDRFDQPLPTAEFYELGFGEPIPLSAREGLNVGDLLDEAVALLPRDEAWTGDAAEEPTSVAIIGRPNVGKSSLLNALLGEERVIVSDAAGTTRDAVDTFLARGERRYVFIDTAGIRRKSRISEPIERYSVQRAQKAISRADVALLVLDAVDGVTAQDQRIAGWAEEAGRAIVLVVNKWDLVEKSSDTMDRYREAIRRELGFVGYAPVVFLSARTGQRVSSVFPAIDRARDEFARRVPTAELNRLLQDAFLATPPPSDRGRRLKLLYATQAAVRPPTFVLFVNDPELATNAYRRYLENQLRRAWGFVGTPVRIILRRREAR